MSRKLMLGRIRALAASLVLAGAAISSTPASADYQTSTNCWQQVGDECSTEWQAWGYRTYDDCVRIEPCAYCTNWYHCGWIDYYPPGKPRPD